MELSFGKENLVNLEENPLFHGRVVAFGKSGFDVQGLVQCVAGSNNPILPPFLITWRSDSLVLNSAFFFKVT